MKNLTIIFFCFFFSHLLFSQGNFAPNASTIGTTAIHKDSSVFINWAINCTVKRGWQNILDTTLGKANTGTQNNALGKSGVNGIVSLGDKGEATLTFEHPIFNGIGNDFAVFENAFNDSFLELAFVEVSSDGVNYVRFPSFSETQDTMQIDGFGNLEASNLYNLAGKYRAGYGTPFDLEELKDSLSVDINNISFIKVIDVVGILNNINTSFDNTVNQINDPFPTPYPSSGFDLDAIGVIHQFVGVKEKEKLTQVVFPNPSSGSFTIQYNNFEQKSISIIKSSGKVIKTTKTNQNYINIRKNLSTGAYFVITKINNSSIIDKLIIY